MNAADIMEYGQLMVLHTIASFPEDAWETAGACGTWSVKDIVAHLASYEMVLVDILTTFTGDEPTPTLSSFIELGGQFNEIEVNRRRARTIQEILAEFNDTHTQAATLLASISAERLREVGTLPWYGMAYALDDLFVYMYYGHKREHCAQIAAFCDGLRAAQIGSTVESR